MELKILILDDEYIILDGLCSFPWEMSGEIRRFCLTFYLD